jgi:hypothetical protein
MLRLEIFERVQQRVGWFMRSRNLGQRGQMSGGLNRRVLIRVL